MIRFGKRIPVLIRPTFWLFAAIIAFIYGRTLWGTLIWTGIIFVSVLFHEYGHALTAMFFGRKPRIEIVALGGLTMHDGEKLRAWKQFLIVLNGPLFGLLLAVCAWLLMKLPFLSQGMPAQVLWDIALINVFWTVINLLPILPLDGGQMLRIVLEAFFGAKGLRYSLVIGVGLSIVISLALFLLHDYFLGAFFFLFAFQCFEMWRGVRGMTDTDRQDNLKEIFMKAEEALLTGRKDEAMQNLISLRAQAKKGLLWKTATQQLAVLYFQSGNRDEAYKLFQEVQDDLSDEAASALHELAFEKGNYSLVDSLSPRVFRISQVGAVALRSAYAAAQLKNVKSAIGWLQAAIETEESDQNEILASTLIDPVRNDPAFTKFLDSLK